jgi:type I restriction enzyme M protein
MKEVVKLIEKVVSEKQIDRHQGLNAVLDFLIGMFDVNHYLKPDGWMGAVAKAEKEEPHLFKIMLIWMDKVATAMENGTWLDFFGGIYEEMYQSKGKASTLGQFYTPPALCDLLAFCTGPNEGRVSDSACGSGRTLLAAASNSGFCRSNFYVGEDIDLTSVKMCALNLMIHGCRGRVVQHDTLMNPICFDYGFRINDIRYPMPTPFYSLTRIKLAKEDLNPSATR